MDLRPGQVVFGETDGAQYEIIQPIGNGSFGMVFEVHDQNGCIFALKSISTGWVPEIGLQTLLNEGRLAMQIHHENVLNVLFFHDGRKYPNLPAYVLMEYAEGGTLEGLLQKRKAENQQFTADELSLFFYQLASGMRAINEKLVHRDIKPDNILLHNEILKISDFGLSKIVGAATRSQTFKGINHAKYCAPEAWLLDKNLPTMDMYSMGIVFFEMACLHEPYQVKENGNFFENWKNAHLTQIPEDPRKYNNNLDLRLSQLILKMISKRPEDRYTTWDQVIQRLTSEKTTGETKRDISKLVEYALNQKRKAEQERLSIQEKERRENELADLVRYSFKNTIIHAARDTVEEFNLASDFVKLIILEHSGFSCSITRVGKTNIGIEIVITPDFVNKNLLNGKVIKAWGYIKSSSGKGFNIVLVSSGPDDLYGTWKTLYVTHSALVQRLDNRPDPFPFNIDELPREIQFINATHIYQTEVGTFEAGLLDTLIEELI